MDYSTFTKDDLLAEINSRKSAGRVFSVSPANTKAELITALEGDDADSSEHSQGDLPEGIAEGGIPDVFNPSLSALPDSEYRGRYVCKDDQQTYALAVVEDELYGKTHRLKNTLKYWEGTEREFKDHFDKK